MICACPVALTRSTGVLCARTEDKIAIVEAKPGSHEITDVSGTDT